MPIHDWTCVHDGTWHDFHLGWVSELQTTFNTGALPSKYYAQAEQFGGRLLPGLPFTTDVDALAEHEPESGGGGLAVAAAPPKPKMVAQLASDFYVRKRRTVVIRHVSGDEPVAILELVSPGNKGSRMAYGMFLDKAEATLSSGCHLLIVDLFPPGPRDPNGLHALIWDEISGGSFTQPPDEPLSLMAYSAGFPKVSYVEPTAIGRELIEMPLFLDPEYYVNVPLETTYQRAYRGVPRRWRNVLEAPSA